MEEMFEELLSGDLEAAPDTARERIKVVQNGQVPIERLVISRRCKEEKDYKKIKKAEEEAGEEEESEEEDIGEEEEFECPSCGALLAGDDEVCPECGEEFEDEEE